MFDSVHSLEAMEHPRCVGFGEIGLDYHYDNSPRDVQQTVFIRQLRHAVRLGKPLTIHTREADSDIERILKAEVPQNHRVSLPYHFDFDRGRTKPLKSKMVNDIFSLRFTFIASRTALP